MKKFKLHFETNLKEERDKVGISQFELAKQMGVTQGAIQYIETGQRTPNVFLAMDIAKYFGKEVHEMFWLINE
jgi:putative transcriptional regulator